MDWDMWYMLNLTHIFQQCGVYVCKGNKERQRKEGVTDNK